ncbi:MAG: 3-hydroxybutyryl-CoA dehydrogenase [Frankiales bacterium]|nr:3-hydroxybutyryl-CoA dehydrogenase [Frankiales bacterium]
MSFQNVAVIGGGTMGAGIAEVTAKAGCDVIVLEVSEPAVEAGRTRIGGSLAKALRNGRIDEAEHDAVLGRIRFVTDYAELHDRDLVIEAAPESAELKFEIFRTLDAVVQPNAVLASNTSSIPLVKMAAVTKRPTQVVGVHFFNPVPVLPLVEIVESLLTSQDTLLAVTDFAEKTLHKQTIRSKDRAGFVVNALLVPYILSAVRMLESGFASAEDIDLGMVKGCAHPMGPLALADLIGLDTCAAIAESMYAEFKEQLFTPPPLLLRMCEAGLLGRKSGRGFFSYA